MGQMLTAREVTDLYWRNRLDAKWDLHLDLVAKMLQILTPMSVRLGSASERHKELVMDLEGQERFLESAAHRLDAEKTIRELRRGVRSTGREVQDLTNMYNKQEKLWLSALALSLRDAEQEQKRYDKGRRDCSDDNELEERTEPQPEPSALVAV